MINIAGWMVLVNLQPQEMDMDMERYKHKDILIFLQPLYHRAFFIEYMQHCAGTVCGNGKLLVNLKMTVIYFETWISHMLFLFFL